MQGLSTKPVRALAVVNGAVVAGSDRGMFRCLDNEDSVVPAGLTDTSIDELLIIGRDLFAATFGEGLLRSTDNGATWTPINEGLTEKQIISLAVGDETIYVGTIGSGIWKRPLSTTLSGVEDMIASRPIISDLYFQPNPASNRTIVYFDSDKPSSVTITMYDVMGRIVAHPVVEELYEGGRQQITLETHKLAVGIYLCSINAGGIVRSTRLVVAR
jgi:hypothetical protein